MDFWKNEYVIALVGVVIGGMISFFGTVYSSQLKLQEIRIHHQNRLDLRSIEKKEQISYDMIQIIYSLQKMNDGLIDNDLFSFKESAYTIMAQAKIYSDSNVVELYNEFLTIFFTEHVYDGQLVDNKLIPAIREDLGIGKNSIINN